MSRLFHTCWGDPLAIQAVTQGDIPLFQDLQQTALPLLEMHNSTGFNAKEIASYLRFLPSPSRLFQVLPKNESHFQSMDQHALEQFFHFTYSDSLCFSNYPSFKALLRQRPYLLSKSLLGGELYRLGNLYRSHTKKELYTNTSIRWVGDDIGYGLFTEEPLDKGTIIGELTGTVRRLHRWHPDTNPYCFLYPTRLWSLCFYVIDSQDVGNELRFINHSDHPNLEPQWVIDRELLHLLFYTKTPLKRGAELTYNYGNDYWRHRKKRPLSNY